MAAKTVKKPTATTTETDEVATYYTLPISDPEGFWIRVAFLFAEGLQHHTEGKAREIFKDVLGKRRARDLRNWALLIRHDNMKPEPEPFKLARQLVEEKPRGRNPAQEIATMHKQIMRLIKKRNECIKNGTWRGPGGPVKRITKGAIRIRVQ